MAICQIMVRDFMHGDHEEGYGVYDLDVGLDYARALLEEGYTREPFHGYDLVEFVAWALKKRTQKIRSSHG